MKKQTRIIDADKFLKAAGYKMPSQEVIQMQLEISQSERDAKEGVLHFPLSQRTPVEIEKAAARFLAEQLAKIK